MQRNGARLGAKAELPISWPVVRSEAAARVTACVAIMADRVQNGGPEQRLSMAATSRN